MLKQYVLSEDEKSTFFKEAMILKKLVHANIVELDGIVYDPAGENEKYLLMPFYVNGDLETWWEKRYVDREVDIAKDVEKVCVCIVCYVCFNVVVLICKLLFVFGPEHPRLPPHHRWCVERVAAHPRAWCDPLRHQTGQHHDEERDDACDCGL